MKTSRNFKIVIPLIAEQLATSLIGLVDTVMISFSSESEIAAISSIDSINVLLIAIFTGFASGGSIVISNFIGKCSCNDAKYCSVLLFRLSFFMSMLFSIPLIIFSKWIPTALFGFMDTEIIKHSSVYLIFSSISYPLTALSTSLSCSLRAYGNTTISLYSAIVMNIIHFALNIILLFHFNLGTVGIGISLIISKGFALGFVLICVKKSKWFCNMISFEKNKSIRLQSKLLIDILKNALPMCFENSIFQIGRVFVQTAVVSCGTAAIAANAAANTIAGIITIPVSSIGLFLVTEISQMHGKGESINFEVKRQMRIAYILNLSFCILTFIMTPIIFSLFKLSIGSLNTAKSLLQQYCIFCAVLYPTSFVLPNILRGIGLTRQTMLASLISMWSLRIGLSFALISFTQLGIHGVWIAMYCDWLLRSILFFLIKKRRKDAALGV